MVKSPVVQSVLESESLPSLPAVAVEILELTNRSDVGLDDLADAVMRDPALTASILRLVNSPLFGVTRTVASIRQATSLLGMRSIKVLALSFSLTRVVMSEDEGYFDYPTFWRRSLTTAVAGRLLADEISPDLREEIFVAGLLSDVGQAALFMCRPDLFESLEMEAGRLGDSLEAERQVLGISHAHLGEAILEKWQLPPEICAAVGAHHGEGVVALKGESRELADLLISAAELARLFCIDVSIEEIDRVIDLCRSRLSIDAESLDTLLDTLANHVQETANILALSVGPASGYDSIRREAEGRLRQLAAPPKSAPAVAADNCSCNKGGASALLPGVNELFAKARTSGRSVAVVLMCLDQCLGEQEMLSDRDKDRARGAMIAWLSEFSRHRGLCGQFSDDCFALVIPSAPSVELRRICEELQRQIPGAVMPALGAGAYAVTASIAGTTVFPAGEIVEPVALLNRLAATLAEAVRAGGGRVEVCDLGLAA